MSLLVAPVVAVVCLSGTAHAEPGVTETSGIRGVDVSNWTGQVDWAAVAAGGGAFAFVHASEGLNYRNPLFAEQEGGAAAAGLIRGAYHFAQPHESDGAAQADFFVDNGGGWAPDGQTLPGVLDIEDNPYTSRNGLDNCYGMDQGQAVAWLDAFTSRYRERTGRDAIIYTTTSWWRTCTGNSTTFGRNPLWLARWGAEPGALPAGWLRHTFWQAADKGALPGGQNVFNGTLSQLRTLAQPPAELAAAGRVAGDNAYVVTVLNTAPIPAAGIEVVGRSLGGRKIVKAGPGCLFSGTEAHCSIAELSPGGTAELRFVTKPNRQGRKEGAGAGRADKAGRAAREDRTPREERTAREERAAGDDQAVREERTVREERAARGDQAARENLAGGDDQADRTNGDDQAAREGRTVGDDQVAREERTVREERAARGDQAARENLAGGDDRAGRTNGEDRERGMRVTIGTVVLTVGSER
ncbi:GH25 family lysozyme [Streptosporangium carneum]|nr:GH25 family lysozyme [Streptosporangium carneum]